MFRFASIWRWSLLAVIGTLAGCTIHPAGEREERSLAEKAGQPFEKQFEVRNLPPLPDQPTPDQLVERALLTNASIEQRYWEWLAAIEQIPQDGTQSTSLNIAVGTTITKGHTSWGSTTLMLANDPMTDIKWPSKLDAAAKQTLENAQATGQRFLKAKYELRAKVLGAYYDYALNTELIRLAQANQQLLKTTAATTAARNRAGDAGQQDVLKANNEADMARNGILIMQSQLPAQRAAINALLSRPLDTPLEAPTEMQASRTLVYEDTEIVDFAAKRNPELLALADEIRGRRDGVRLAKLQYVPDFNLSAGTDLMGIAQSVLGQATIPIFRFEALNAAIAQAEANLRASEAMRRQTSNDLSSQLVSDITAIRDADRQLDLYEHTVLPRAHGWWKLVDQHTKPAMLLCWTFWTVNALSSQSNA